MSELIELDIIAFDQIEFERKSYPQQHAIYFLTPSKETVDFLNMDFANKKSCRYGFAHIFFTNKIPPFIMQ